MPLFRFRCSKHGEFSKLTKVDDLKAPCPTCNTLSDKVTVIPQSTPQTLDTPGHQQETLSEDKINQRVARDSDLAWSIVNKNRAKRIEAESNLSAEERLRQQDNLQYRKKLQEVIDSEPESDLEEGQLRLWREKKKQEQKMKEKYGSDIKTVPK